MRSSLAALFGAGLLVGGALAPPAWALEAEQLRAEIQETFSLYEAAGPVGAPLPYAYDTIEVEDQGDGFRVSLTGLRILLDPAEDGRLDIGSTAFTMTPDGERGGDELFRISDLSVPPRWLISKGGKPPTHVIRPGSLTLEGLWSFAYLSMLDAKVSTAGVSVETPAGESLARFETVRGEYVSRPAEQGRYDVDGKLRVDGITFRDEELRVALAGIEGKVEMPDHDPAAAAEVLRAAARARQSPSAGAEEAPPGFLSDMLYLSRGGRVSFDLRDFRSVRDDSREAVEIDSISVGYAVSNLEESVARLDLDLAQTGLRFTGPDRQANGLAAALMPADGRAVLSLERLPLRTLLALLEPLAEEVATAEIQGGGDPKGEGTGDRRAADAGEKLIGAMSDAGTTLDLSGTRLAAPDAEVGFKGGLVIDSDAAFGARGTVLAEVGGFDFLVQLAQESLEDPDPKVRDNARGVVGLLALLQAFTDRDETGARGPVDRFLIKVGPDGALSVNDKPLLPPQPAQ
ncbi:MAG: hypothetical protein QNJ30_27015 [Kiloniellales bacterium]|nr:hypothetical protein [Kiloniellales bacterium]